MVYQPSTQDSIYTSLQGRLTGKIAKLTNFAPTSFNYIWTRAFSDNLYEYEVAILASHLSGFIDYAGGPISQSDLDRLGISDIDPDDVNEYMDDGDLDELVKIVGVSRDPGEEATGELLVETIESGITVQSGREFGTEPDSEGNYLSYVTTSEIESPQQFSDTLAFSSSVQQYTLERNYLSLVEVTGTLNGSSATFTEGTDFEINDSTIDWSIGGDNPDDGTDFTVTYSTNEVNADIQAAEVGDGYNIGSGQVTYMPNPPTGVQSVTNPEAVSGGINEEPNDELRQRAKNAILNQSGGGTTAGIEGFIQDGVEGVSAVSVDEFYTGGSKQSAPYADVIVDGGDDAAVEDAIDASHPSGVRHYLVRPTIYTVNVRASVEGVSIDTGGVEEELTEYLSGLQIGERAVKDRMIQLIMNADENITNIDTMEIEIDREPHTYTSGTSVYQLNKQLMDDEGDHTYEEGITEVVGTLSGTAETTFTEDLDYREWNSSAGNSDPPHDSIDWSIGGDNPDDSTEFYVTYLVEEDISAGQREKLDPGTIAVTEA